MPIEPVNSDPKYWEQILASEGLSMSRAAMPTIGRPEGKIPLPEDVATGRNRRTRPSRAQFRHAVRAAGGRQKKGWLRVTAENLGVSTRTVTRYAAKHL